MSTAGNIGFGLLTLLILWILTLIIFVIAIKLQSNIAWIALGLTSAVTIVLLVIPTEKPEDTPQLGDVEKDYIIVYKNLILIFLVASFIAGLLILFIGVCIEPIRPKPLKTFHDY